MSIYIKKLLSLAAENSFLALKALNIKFTPTQINSVDSKGNTALYYATKHRNIDFIDYLLAFKADVNIRCVKGTTPLHNAFKSSNYSIICKCLMSTNNPNLNALDD
jgi:ankyrin repeat protein